MQYQPTKIAIERRLDRQEEIDQEFRAYQNGDFVLPGDEIYQLGFRLASRLALPRVHCIDAWGRYYDPPVDLETYAKNRTTKELQKFLSEQLHFNPFDDLQRYAQEHGQAHYVSQWLQKLEMAGTQNDKERAKRTIRESLLIANHEATIWQSHASYLEGLFEIGAEHEYPGADYVTAWYSRNLRIFANLQRIMEANDRILLIIGAGHIPILRQCVLASSRYSLVEAQEFLG